MISKLGRVTLLGVTLFCLLTCMAQKKVGFNLIPDSSFENHGLLFDGNSINADSFNKLNKFWSEPTNNTPDLLSTEYKKGTKLPKFYYPLRDNYFNTISDDTILLYPHSGNSLVGFVIFSTANTFVKYKYSREFIQTSLSQKIKPNVKYHVSFYYIKKSSFVIRDSTPPLGFFFSDTAVKNRDSKDCYLRTDCTFFKEQYNPQLQFYNLPFSYSKTPIWEHITSTFKSRDTGLSYLTIGHFSDTTFLDKHFARDYIQEIGYFIDDISIHETPCIVAPDTLCFNSITPITTTLGMPYFWSNKPDGSDTLSTDSIFNYQATQSKMIYAFGQFGKDSLYINVLRVKRPQWQDTMHFCSDSVLILKAGPNNYKYMWNTGSNLPSVNINKTGQYNVTLKDGNCSDSASTYVIKENLPLISLEKNYTICQAYSDIIVLDAGDHYYCNWQPIQSNDCQIFISYFVDLTLTVKDKYGCTNTQEISVKNNCYPRIFIPNAMHLDGVNKTFAPQIMYAKTIELKIFSRWGEILFTQNGQKIEWDGKYQGEYCMPGLYYFTIRVTPLDGEDIIDKGCLRIF